MLTSQQLKFYRALWAEVCTEQGWKPGSEEAEERRAALHAQCKLPASSKDFSRRHLDAFKSACARLTGQRAELPEDQERKRLIWRIEQDAKAAGFDEAYIEKLAFDLHGLGAWQHLHLSDLTNLRNTIHNRASKKAKLPRRPYTLNPAKTFTPRPAEVPADNPF